MKHKEKQKRRSKTKILNGLRGLRGLRGPVPFGHGLHKIFELQRDGRKGAQQLAIEMQNDDSAKRPWAHITCKFWKLKMKRLKKFLQASTSSTPEQSLAFPTKSSQNSDRHLLQPHHRLQTRPSSRCMRLRWYFCTNQVGLFSRWSRRYIMAPSYVLAIDQGTTSTRAILFDKDGQA